MMTQSMATPYSKHLQDVIYESPDGGKTIRVRRQWDSKSHVSDFQMLDILDIMHYSEKDSVLKDMVEQMFMYFNLKYRGE